MTVTFDLESVEGVAIGIFRGRLTGDALKEAGGTMGGLTKGPQVRLLWDFREASFDFDSAEVRELAEFSKQLAASIQFRSAMVASRNREFALLGMYVVFREEEGGRISVFRDKQHAVDWLTSDDGRELGVVERELLASVLRLRDDLKTPQRSTSVSFHSLFTEAGLTRREEEIANALMVRGGAKELSAFLGVSRHTIRNHQRNIYSKLGVRSEADLLRKFLTELTIAAH